jgi:hypothetical protein
MTEGPSIGILVDRGVEKRLRRALPGFPLVALPDWVELAFFDLESSPWALFVDPMLIPAKHRPETMQHLGRRGCAPLILYAKLTPDVAPVLLEMGKLGFRFFLAAEIDDGPDEVRAILVKALSRCIRQEP